MSQTKTATSHERDIHWLNSRRRIVLLGATWCAGMVGGFALLLLHGTDVGPIASDSVTRVSVPRNEVSTSTRHRFTPEKGHLQIVVALHPKCPCSMNTLRQLEELLRMDPIKTHCTFLVNLPRSQPLAWMDSKTMQYARGLPNVRIIADHDSELAGELGLTKSGESILINSEGDVAFQGGITGSRSCRLDNPGSKAVEQLIRRTACATIATPTFGCPLN